MTPPHNLYLSNSMLRDYETSCPIEFKARWFDHNPLYEYTSDAMERGNVFESMVIGLSVNQQFTPPSDALKKSVYYSRILNQSKVALAWLDSLGGKILARQEYLQGVVTDLQGRSVYIRGNLDIRYGWKDNPLKQAVIDLKFTGDAESEWGFHYNWGSVQDMDTSQSTHYHILHKLNFPKLTTHEFYYGVFDHSAKEKWAPIQIHNSEQTITDHIERCSRAYHGIVESLNTGVWQPISKYHICKRCKVKCPAEKKFPDLIQIHK